MTTGLSTLPDKRLKDKEKEKTSARENRTEVSFTWRRLAAEGGIEGVEIAGIEVILHHAEGFKRASEVDFCE